MECADSKASMDNISKNKVSAVGTEKVVKWCSHNILAIKIPIELSLIVSLVLYRPTNVYEL